MRTMKRFLVLIFLCIVLVVSIAFYFFNSANLVLVNSDPRFNIEFVRKDLFTACISSQNKKLYIIFLEDEKKTEYILQNELGDRILSYSGIKQNNLKTEMFISIEDDVFANKKNEDEQLKSNIIWSISDAIQKQQTLSNQSVVHKCLLNQRMQEVAQGYNGIRIDRLGKDE